MTPPSRVLSEEGVGVASSPSHGPHLSLLSFPIVVTIILCSPFIVVVPYLTFIVVVVPCSSFIIVVTPYSLLLSLAHLSDIA
jgi:hypothetical protein